MGRKANVPSRGVQEENKPNRGGVQSEDKKPQETVSKIVHKKITYEGRQYEYHPDCPCSGCRDLRLHPEPTICDWCHEKHCGGAEHCSTSQYGGGGDLRQTTGTDGSSSGDDNKTQIPEGLANDICGIIADRVKAITKTIKEIANDMLPRYQGETTTEPARTPSGGGRRTRERDGHEYLKWQDLSSDWKTAKILACQPMEDNFNKGKTLVMCKLSLEGKIRLFPLRVNNPNLEVLQNAFGVDENDWVDRHILLKTEEHSITGQHQIVADVPEQKESTRRKK